HVGDVTAYAISYFARPTPPLLARFNDWGANLYTYVAPDGALLWDSQDEALAEIDVDLRRWVESGDLRWIAPDDGAMQVRTGVHECPYLDLEGSPDFRLLESSGPGASAGHRPRAKKTSTPSKALSPRSPRRPRPTP
ncbi:MAG: hypothetical protein ABIO67_05675, partial [Mycobacteriales bacterium]